MTWIKSNWPFLTVLLLLVALILLFVFQKHDSGTDAVNAYKQQVIRDSLKSVIHERDSIQSLLDLSQDSIANHIDSLLHVEADKQNKILYELQKQREVVVVPNYGSDTLRQYFSRLLPIYHDLHTQ